MAQYSRSKFLVSIVIFLALSWEWCESRRSGKSPSTRETVKNPIEEMLGPVASVERQEGTAAAILVDTSGSMADNVEDADGQPRPKIKIAQRAVVDLIRQFDRFAREHPDHRILVGIYEFSTRERKPSCRRVAQLGPPDLAAAESAVSKLKAQGGTPIGDAMITAKRDLDGTGLSRRHILVVTDGQNTRGYSPSDVAEVISRQSEPERASIYFVAFDVEADRFNAVRDAGGLVLGAANARALKETLDYVLTGKILVEQPTTR